MKILLMCGAGASSGFMAQAMRKAAKEQGIENFEIIARSEACLLYTSGHIALPDAFISQL